MENSKYKNIGIIILIGSICAIIPFATIYISNFFTFSNVPLQAIKGVIIGISFLPIMLFIGITVQDKKDIKANKQLLTASILGSTYSFLNLISLININMITSKAGEFSGIISTIFNILIIPTLILITLATIFTIIGTINNKYGFALTGAILFTITLCIPMFILCYIGAGMIKNSNDNAYYNMGS